MIDIQELIEIIRTDNLRHPVMKAIKRELSESNRWRNLPRGNPKKGYINSKKNTVKPR
jgi:hypothetical protein